MKKRDRKGDDGIGRVMKRMDAPLLAPPRPSIPSNPSRGSVLIDVMFGTVLIGIVVTALFLAFALANRIALRTKHVAIAKGVAESEIEEIRRTDYGSLAIGTATEPVTTLPDGEKEVTTIYFDPPANRIIQVTVTISWRERQTSESFTLTTLSTEGGVGR